ncbi:adenine phosphoribosyltransferase [Ilumatobacter fluminis]|uniref:Adenine phosphoribosyltransferase n=1 Tax=Ilumatobacter fluminis TaxID=467091 RepID=A0A4R7HZ71_9ACTN|nr:phosphoribosyltransferase family protein [Ilumatobacter fluminis]TDT15453.1 adenine phosphoribosyltransferase [Ilumatobacter fluminis]
MIDRATARAAVLAGFPLVNDHPDVAGVLRRPDLLAELGPALAAPYADADVSVVCAPEARGPILGALVAVELGAGLVLVRKDDRNHPGADRRVVSSPTWRGASESFQTRSWDIEPADRVLVVDDWVTTGSSLRAVRSLVLDAGARYVGASVLVRKADDETIDDLAVEWLVHFDEIVGR